MTVNNLSSQKLIKKAELAYSLDMITEGTLNFVIKNASTVPGYTGIMELPYDWEIEQELKLRRE